LPNPTLPNVFTPCVQSARRHSPSSRPGAHEPRSRRPRKIDALLVAAGWAIQDYRAFNPTAARGIALREVPLESGGRDCLLLVDRVPFGVIEAKKEGTTLSTVSAQSALQGERLPDSLAHLLPGTKQRPLASETTGVETL
jgi:type I restriction enzyme R subunit